MKILHIDASILGEASASRAISAAAVERLLARHPGAELVRRDLAADVVVIGVPMYNFSIPSQLKAWIDRILVAGRTFSYGADGVPKGLAGGKQVIVALARGGRYGAGSPAAAAEHAETYLRAVFGFIGVTAPEFLIAEGLMMGPQIREAAMAEALGSAARLDAAA